MKKCQLICLLLLCSSMLRAQTAVDSVKATINNLFTAMKTADSTLLKSCFADSAIMQTIARDRAGNSVIRTEPLAAFAGFVGTLPKGAADERISYDMVKVDGPLATAWTPYQFYMNGQFSHCGVNSFQLVRMGSAWKIQYIVDTRRKQGCNEK